MVAYLALNFVSKMFLTLGPGMTEFMEKYKEEIQGFRMKTISYDQSYFRCHGGIQHKRDFLALSA